MPSKNPAPNKNRRQALEEAYEGDSGKGYGYNHWEKQLTAYKKVYEKWEERCDRIIDVYSGSNSTMVNPSRARYNIFYSVISTLMPAVYARTPRPDVCRRFKDTDPAARVASLLLERALEYEIDSCPDYREALNLCTFDYLVAGRAVAWLRYEPHIRAREKAQPTDGLEITEDVDEPQEELIGEESRVDYVHAKEFCYTAGARTWEEVDWIGRYCYMSRKAVEARFGKEIAEQVPYDSLPDSRKRDINKLDNKSSAERLAEIVEIWDKCHKMVYWLCPHLGRILEKVEDPLNLPNFFPVPRPLFFGCMTDSLVPLPLYVQIQDACTSLNILAERQRALIEGMKLRGVYDAEFKELARLLSEGEDNSLVPITNYAGLSEKGGLQQAVQLLDLTPQAQALQATFEAMEALKQQIYDISAVSDVMRGTTDPQETATAQTLKSVSGDNRLKTMQLAIANFASDLLKLKASLICNQYSDDTILKIAGADQLSPEDQPLIPQALMILRDEPLRKFKIEVSADSLILRDEIQERADRMEFINAVGGYFQQALPLAAQSKELAPLAVELLKFMASAFKAGKSVEGLLDQTADLYRQQYEQTKDQPPPPPIEVQKMQMQIQADQQAAQMKLQQDQANKQLELQLEQQKAELQAQTENAKQAAQAEQERQKNILEDERAQRELQAKYKLEERKMFIDAKLRLAEIHAKNAGTLSAEQIKGGLSDGVEDENREIARELDLSANPIETATSAISASNRQVAHLVEQLYNQLRAPKQLVRDANGQAIGATVEVNEMPPVEPSEEIARVQQMNSDHPHMKIAQHALRESGDMANILLKLIEETKRPRKIKRDANNKIMGVH